MTEQAKIEEHSPDFNLLQNDEEGIVYSSAAEPILYPADKWNIRPRLVEVGGSVQEYDPNPYRVLQMLYLIWNEDAELLSYEDCLSSNGRLISYDVWIMPIESSPDSVDWEFRGFCDYLYQQSFRVFKKEIQDIMIDNEDGLIEEVLLRQLVDIQRRLWEFRRHRSQSSQDSRPQIRFSFYLRALKEIVIGLLSKLANFLCIPDGLKFIFQVSASGQSRLTSLFYLIHPKRIFHTLACKRRQPEEDMIRKQITLVNCGILRAALERPYYERVRLVESISTKVHVPESAHDEFYFEHLRKYLEELALWQAELTKVYQDWTAFVAASSTSSHGFDIPGSGKISTGKLVSAARRNRRQLVKTHGIRRSVAQELLDATDVELKAIVGCKKGSMLTKWVCNRFGNSKLVRNELTLEQYNSRGALKDGDRSTLTLEQVECLIYDPRIAQVLEDCFVDHWERLPGAAVGGGNGAMIEKSVLETSVVWVYFSNARNKDEKVAFEDRMRFYMNARLMLVEILKNDRSALFQLRSGGENNFDEAERILNDHDKGLFDEATRQSTPTSSTPSIGRDERCLVQKRERGVSARNAPNPDSSEPSSTFVENPPVDEDNDGINRKTARTDYGIDAIDAESSETGLKAKSPLPLIPSLRNTPRRKRRSVEKTRLEAKPLLSPSMIRTWHEEMEKGSRPSCSTSVNPTFDPIAALPPLVDLTENDRDSSNAELSGNCDSTSLGQTDWPARRPFFRSFGGDFYSQPTFPVSSNFEIQEFRTLNQTLRYPSREFCRNYERSCPRNRGSDYAHSVWNYGVPHLHNRVAPSLGNGHPCFGSNNDQSLPFQNRVISQPSIQATEFYNAADTAGLPLLQFDIMNPYGPSKLIFGAHTNLTKEQWNRMLR